MDIPSDLVEVAASWATLKRWERRELGQALRRLGLAYREIREIIPVAKGTLSAWCREVELTPDQVQRLRDMARSGEARRAKAGATLHKRAQDRREAIRANARAEVRNLASDPRWVAGVVAYWAEGAKRSKELQFSNSDPGLIRLFLGWAQTYLGIDCERFLISLHLHDGQDEIERKLYWSEVTGLPLSQFRKTFVKPEGTGHRKNVLYHGTASIRVRRGLSDLHRVLGWIEALNNDWLSR